MKEDNLENNTNKIGALIGVGSILIFILLSILPFIIIYYVVKSASK